MYGILLVRETDSEFPIWEISNFQFWKHEYEIKFTDWEVSHDVLVVILQSFI